MKYTALLGRILFSLIFLMAAPPPSVATQPTQTPACNDRRVSLWQAPALIAENNFVYQ
jgi:hypothetical protein